MPPSLPQLRVLFPVAETLAIATAGGVIFTLIGFPAGLMSGSMLATALAALYGRPIANPLPPARAAGAFSLTELAVLVAASAASAVLVQWIRFPGGLLFGAMAASAILHGAGFVHATIPWWLGSAAVVILGGLVGSRFAN